jgi:hypothetical protein
MMEPMAKRQDRRANARTSNAPISPSMCPDLGSTIPASNDRRRNRLVISPR